MTRHIKASEKRGLKSIRRAPRSVLRRVFNDLHRETGRKHEEDALRALQPGGGAPLPPWLHSAVRGTIAEDQRGIDIVVHTDVGKLYLQIKSSWSGVRKFLARYRKGNIIPYIVRTDDLGILRARIVARLAEERDRIIALRSGP